MSTKTAKTNVGSKKFGEQKKEKQTKILRKMISRQAKSQKKVLQAMKLLRKNAGLLRSVTNHLLEEVE